MLFNMTSVFIMTYCSLSDVNICHVYFKNVMCGPHSIKNTDGGKCALTVVVDLMLTKQLCLVFPVYW